MRKIIFYIDSMQKGGANRVIANLTDFCSKEGYKVVLINDICSQKGIPEYIVNSNVKRLFLDVKGRSKIITNIKRIIKLRKIFKIEAPNVIVSFMGPPNIRMLLASIGVNTKKVVSVRNDPYVEYGNNAITKWAKCQLFKLCDMCVFQTSNAALYFPKSVQKKSKIILNPINDSFYQIKRIDNPQDIITVGRLERQKNHELLIRAFALISNDFPKENLYIYGEGSLRNELEKLIQELHLTNRVLMPGNISDVANKLSEAKLFVLSSDYEGLPNALMEAMAVGVPVISTDCPCGGPSELIQTKDQGFLVECGDVTQLSKKMQEILENQQLRETMAINSKRRADCFAPKKIYKEWETVFSESQC